MTITYFRGEKATTVENRDSSNGTVSVAAPKKKPIIESVKPTVARIPETSTPKDNQSSENNNK